MSPPYRCAVPQDFTVSGRIVQSLVYAVEVAGVPGTAFLQAAQLAPESLASCRPLCSEVYRLFDLALELTGDPALGLHWHEEFHRHTFNPLRLMLLHAPTLRHAFTALSQYGRLLTDHAGYQIEERHDTVAVRCALPSTASASAHRFITEFHLGGLVQLIACFGPVERIQRVDFDYAAPRYGAEYAQVFQGAVRFGQPHNEVVFARALMDAVSPDRDEEVHRELRTIAERRIVEMMAKAPYSMQVRDLLVRQASAEGISMATVARALGLSERSLRRRIHEEGTSFHAVVDEARATVAKSLLRRHSALPIHDLAHQLGFTEISSLYRAFKRWTGTTPGAYRESLRQAAS